MWHNAPTMLPATGLLREEGEDFFFYISGGRMDWSFALQVLSASGEETLWLWTLLTTGRKCSVVSSSRCALAFVLQLRKIAENFSQRDRKAPPTIRVVGLAASLRLAWTGLSTSSRHYLRPQAKTVSPRWAQVLPSCGNRGFPAPAYFI